MDSNPRKTCSVCYAKAHENKYHGEHYGAICCHKCRLFFGRTVQKFGQENLKTSYACDSNSKWQKCDMKEYGRNHRCAKCRLTKCLQIGMDPLKVNINREFRQSSEGRHTKK